MIYWVYFILAVITEVIGTLTMKYAMITGGSFGLIIMYIMILGSYICLAIAIKRIPLGIAYALWEGIGGFLIAIFSVTFLNEPMNGLKLTGLLFLLGGIALVKTGAKNIPRTKRQGYSGGHHGQR